MGHKSERARAGTTLPPEGQPIQSLLFRHIIQQETLIAVTVGLLSVLVLVLSTISDPDLCSRQLMCISLTKQRQTVFTSNWTCYSAASRSSGWREDLSFCPSELELPICPKLPSIIRVERVIR